MPLPRGTGSPKPNDRLKRHTPWPRPGSRVRAAFGLPTMRPWIPRKATISSKSRGYRSLMPWLQPPITGWNSSCVPPPCGLGFRHSQQPSFNIASSMSQSASPFVSPAQPSRATSRTLQCRGMEGAVMTPHEACECQLLRVNHALQRSMIFGHG